MSPFIGGSIVGCDVPRQPRQAPRNALTCHGISSVRILEHYGSYQYTFTDIKNVYGELCGGACGTSDIETWSGLVSAVTSEFGPGSGEYSHWVTKGGEFGVDN